MATQFLPGAHSARRERQWSWARMRATLHHWKLLIQFFFCMRDRKGAHARVTGEPILQPIAAPPRHFDRSRQWRLKDGREFPSNKISSLDIV